MSLRKRKILKRTGIALLVFLCLLTGLYFYIISNAETLLRKFVDRETKGKFALELDKVDFSSRNLRLAFLNAHFFSKDTTGEAKTYDITIDSLILDLSSLRPLIFQKKIIMDTIFGMRPQIQITKWKDIPKENFSLPEQMAKAYSTLDKIVNNLNVQYCVIDSGHFTLIDKVKPNSMPVSVTDYYLRIDNLNHNSGEAKDQRYMFTDRIKFYSSHQDISLPDGKHRVKYGRLRINSLLQSVEIDSCYLYEKKDSGSFAEFGVYVDTIRLTHVDFRSLTETGLIKVDSALCINPVIDLKLEGGSHTDEKNSTHSKIRKDSAEQMIKDMFGDLAVKYVGVNDAVVAVQSMSAKGITSINSQNANIFLWDINVLKAPDIPPSLGGMFLQFKDYHAYNPDSTYKLTFDGVLITNTVINLTNFAIAPTEKNRNYADRKEIRMGFLEMRDISWHELVFHKRIVAKIINMVEPEINITAPVKVAVKGASRQSIYDILGNFSDKFEVEQLNIIRANVNYFGSNKNHLRLDKVNASINVHDLLRAGNIQDFEKAAEDISFSGGIFSAAGNQVILGSGSYSQQNSSLRLSKINFNRQETGMVAELDDVKIDQFSNEGNSLINIGKLDWSRGRITANIAVKSSEGVKPVKNAKKEFQLIIGELQGKETRVLVKTDKLLAELDIEDLQTNKIDYDNNAVPVIEGLSLKGKNLRFNQPTLKLQVKQLTLDDKKVSHFNELQLYTGSESGQPLLSLTDLSLIPDINSLLAGDNEIKDVVLDRPAIYIESSSSKTAQKTSQKFPRLSINQMDILNPRLLNVPGGLADKFDLLKLQSNIKIAGISSIPDSATINQVDISLKDIKGKTDKINLSGTSGKEELKAVVDKIRLVRGTVNSALYWSANLALLSASNFQLATKSKSEQENKIFIESIDAQNITLQSGKKISIPSLLAENKTMLVRNGNMKIETASNNFMVAGLQYDNQVNQFKLDSFAISPSISRDSFYRKYPWPKDYLNFRAGPTTISGLNTNLYFQDTAIAIQKIAIDHPVISIFKDKSFPPNDPPYKPLLNGMIMKIPVNISVDSLGLHNGDITYEEVSDKTGMHGIVHIAKLHADVQKFKTANHLEADSLTVIANAIIAEEIPLKLRYAQSYLDSLNGFHLGIRLSPFDMKALNSMLQPLVSIKIKRGFLDTIHMDAVGREHVAYGKMRMYYRGLKVQYLNKGDENNKTFKTSIISFAANNIILKKKNRKGYGTVYTERLTQKGFLGYWIRMLLSGVISSTGVKSNRKQERQYHKSIRRMNLPEIEETFF